MMRRIAICLSLAVLTLSLGAQDMQRLAEPDIIGTARYVGMVGAMTAVGGDPSAIHDNPAALGVYRRFESSLSLGGRFDRTAQSTTAASRSMTNPLESTFVLPQVSFVFALGNDYVRKGLIYNNMSFSFNRLASYRRCASARFDGVSSSLAEQMAMSAAGISSADMSNASRWDNERIGWLSLLGYDSYMIDPVGTDSSNWMPYTNWAAVEAPYMRVTESGYLDQFAITWGGNIDNRWFIGVGLNIRSLRYTKITEYTEYASSTAVAALTSTYNLSGVGVNGAVGLMAQPIRWLRIGASFTSPTYVGTTMRTYGVAESVGIHKDGDHTRFRGETPEWVEKRKLYMPLRVSVGAAFIVGRIGLVSLQYDYQHQKDLQDTHALRLGTEWVICRNLFLNAGYAYTFIPGEAAYRRNIAANDVRTDADWACMRRTHHVGAAIGYRGNFTFVQVGYHYALRHQDVYPFATEPSQPLRNHTHDIVVTIGWHSAK